MHHPVFKRKKLICPDCNAELSTMGNLKKHFKDVHSGKKIICPEKGWLEYLIQSDDIT